MAQVWSAHPRRCALALVAFILLFVPCVLSNPADSLDLFEQPLARDGRISHRGQLQPAGGTCSQNSDCATGDCHVPKGQAPNSGKCSSNLGGPCQTTYQCLQGTCKKGVCSKTAVGDKCTSLNQCTDGQLCKHGKCRLPKNGSVYPGHSCTSDAQCKSGRCADDVSIHDAHGYAYGSLGGNPSKCDWFKLGQSGCRSNYECGAGTCQGGKCATVPDGGRCVFTDQCANTCSKNGTCYSPAPYSLAGGEPCRSRQDCIAPSCFPYEKLTRPALNGQGTVTEAEHTCADSYLGQSCRTDDNCMARFDNHPAGACLRDTSSPTGYSCQAFGTGAPCTKARDCNSAICSSTTKTCEGATTGMFCQRDKDCYSQVCDLGYCYDDACLDAKCYGVPKGGKCRIGSDCLSSNCTKLICQ